MDDLAAATQKKHDFLTDKAHKRREEGTNDVFEVISIYGCEYAQLRRDNPEAYAFYWATSRSLRKSEPLRPKDAMRGGRTNAIYRYYKAKDGELILYYDFRYVIYHMLKKT